MAQEKEEKRVRKSGISKGTRSQKMCSFRLDNDIALWLDSQPNKGRYINELIRADRDVYLEQQEYEKKNSGE